MGNMSTKKTPRGFFMRLLRSHAGNIMPMAAIAMIALAGFVGGGVDISRAYMVQNRLQNACDAGVLAGRKAVISDGFDEQAEAEANLYFNTNFDEANEGSRGTAFTPSSPNDGDTVDGVAATTMDTAVMQLFGFDTIPLSVSCTATMNVGNSDVMMVLDVTGSMGCTSAMTDSQCTTYANRSANYTNPGRIVSETNHGGVSRLSELRDAMGNFYNTVDAATVGSNARIRYAFVPYSSAANVGRLIAAENSAWITDEYQYQTRKPRYTVVVTETNEVVGYEEPRVESDTSADNYDYGSWYYYSPYNEYSSSGRCVNALPNDESWTNNGSSSTETDGPDINEDTDQRITTTRTTTPQERRNYSCFYSNYYEGWYRIYRNEERDFYQTTTSTEDPIYGTEETREFDGTFDYGKFTLDTSVYNTFNSVNVMADDGTMVPTVWEGCVQERSTVQEAEFTWSSLMGFNHDDAHDVNIDDAPDIGDPDTMWRPLWPEMSYSRNDGTSTTETTGSLAMSFCPVEARDYRQYTGTGGRDSFTAFSNSLYASGSTYHNVGMVWAGRLGSPTGMFQANVNATPANGGAVARHLIFMTDGEMSTNVSSNTAYGIENRDRYVTDDGSTNAKERHTQRFLAVCEAIKGNGTRLWVIAFRPASTSDSDDTSGLTSDLDTCASANSSFRAANASQLNEKFQEIAKDVGELRITQ